MGLSAIATLAAAASTGYSIYSGEKARKEQKKATLLARQDSEKAAQQADQANNRANPKQPNFAALLKQNRDSESGGVRGTYLTGAGGAPVAPGMLGRSTLLGR